MGQTFIEYLLFAPDFMARFHESSVEIGSSGLRLKNLSSMYEWSYGFGSQQTQREVVLLPFSPMLWWIRWTLETQISKGSSFPNWPLDSDSLATEAERFGASGYPGTVASSGWFGLHMEILSPNKQTKHKIKIHWYSSMYHLGIFSYFPIVF